MAVILYVDDEAINLRLFEINFSKNNKVYLANSGNAALQVMEEHSDITVVFCDMKMPIMGGIEFCYKAKEISPNVQFYLLTGYGLTEELQTAIDEGVVVQYLKKPFVLSELEDAISRTT